MATNEYEYEYEYEADSYSVTPTYNWKTVDTNRELALAEDFSQPVYDDHEIELFIPSEIVLFLDLKTDKLEQQHYNGYVKGAGRHYYLDAFPTIADYRFATPGGQTKANILYWLDEIKTEGRLINNNQLLNATPGRITEQYLGKNTAARNIGFIWIPGNRQHTHKLWWFENDQDPKQYSLNKLGNKIKWERK